jgi:hypothetical protein
MTTSSDHNSKSPLAPRPSVNHWSELSDRLPVASTADLSNWFDTQLAVLEKSQERFVTGRSLMKSLRR